MANELDEMTGTVNGAGRDINVIERQLPVTVGVGSALFEVALWCLFIVPGLVFLFMKIGAKNYFQKLQQKIQADASTIDNYLEQRVMILKNLAKLVEKAIDLDKDVMKAVAAFRGGRLPDSALPPSAHGGNWRRSGRCAAAALGAYPRRCHARRELSRRPLERRAHARALRICGRPFPPSVAGYRPVGRIPPATLQSRRDHGNRPASTMTTPQHSLLDAQLMI